MKKEFEAIKHEYDLFYKSLIIQGKTPVRDTEVGIWGVSMSDNLFDFFKKINLKK